MAIQTAQQKENVAIAYGNAATFGAVYTTAPGASQGTEPTGGSPAYARKSLTWTAGTVDGIVTATAVFDIPSGSTIVGAGVHTAVTAGTYLDGASVTSQAFASQGTYTVTFTYTQS
jgi:hypothetical protein